MMIKRTKVSVFVLSIAFIIGVVFLVDLPDVKAAKIVKVEGAGFSVKETMANNIARFKGKVVTVSLKSGETITGKVVDINANNLHLGELNRMDFFDALIDVGHIGAIKVRFRKYDNE